VELRGIIQTRNNCGRLTDLMLYVYQLLGSQSSCYVYDVATRVVSV
jgi:hypothetical protein